jgi:YD repeat-containing protein
VQGSASTQTLTHDAAGRLTGVAGGSSPGRGTYDGRGNLTSSTVSGTTKTYTYSASNPEEVSSTSISGQPTTYYAYDGDGNTTSITNTGTLHRQLGYDAQARLVQVTLGSPVTSTIALGRNGRSIGPGRGDVNAAS